MIEAEWLTSTDPHLLLEQVRGRVSGRKLRLFAVACSRRVWPWIDDLGRAAVEMAELYADGLIGDDELRAARLACRAAGERASWYAAASDPFKAAGNAARSALSGRSAESGPQADLFRDVMGNPFRTIIVDPGWRTAAVLALAGSIYDERDFERLSSLADALEAAGCDCVALLDHLRGPGPHVRGCWALDLLLGRG